MDLSFLLITTKTNLSPIVLGNIFPSRFNLFEIRKFILQSRASYSLFQLGGSQDQQTQSPVHHVITQLYYLLCGYFLC